MKIENSLSNNLMQEVESTSKLHVGSTGYGSEGNADKTNPLGIDRVSLSEEGRRLAKQGEQYDTGGDPMVERIKERIEKLRKEIEELEQSNLPEKQKQQQIQAKQSEIAELQHQLEEIQSRAGMAKGGGTRAEGMSNSLT